MLDVPPELRRTSLILGAPAGGGHGTERTILIGIRLPRIPLTIWVDAGLSAGGVVFQALLRNPLAEPYILGISSRSTVGAVLTISLSLGAAFGGQAITTPIASFPGSVSVIALVYSVALFNQELRNATMGSIAVVAPVLLVASFLLLLQAKLNMKIAICDETTLQLGSGVIGFVGLIIPHICRMIFGPDHRLLLPVSFLLGASFVLIADLLSRSLVSPAKIPVGAVTAAFGAPLFISLLRKD